MKALLLASIAINLLLTNAFAEPFEVLGQKKARTFIGENFQDGTLANNCLLTLLNDKRFQDNERIGIYLTSFDILETGGKLDGLNFVLNLTKENLPLKEGIIVDRSDLKISYEYGVLSLKSSRPNPAYFGFGDDFEVIKIKTDPELKDIRWARGNKYTERFFFSEVDTEELICEF